jgi:hypothetical protein
LLGQTLLPPAINGTKQTPIAIKPMRLVELLARPLLAMTGKRPFCESI